MSTSPLNRTAVRAMKMASILVAPFVALVMVPLRLIESLWNCRVFTSGRWPSYNRFTARAAINSLFYWTMSLNLERYGRDGISSEVGTGRFPLRKWLAHCVLPLHAYRHLSPLVSLGGMATWWLGHLIWFQNDAAIWKVLVVLLAAVSTVTYANIFVLQNYNVLGWAFFPLAIGAVLTGALPVATAAWLAASFMSPTVVIMGCMATLGSVLSGSPPLVLLTLVPAVFKCATHLFPRGQAEGGGGFAFIVRSIGLTRGAVQFPRPSLSALSYWHAYYLVLYAQFAVTCFLRGGEMPWIFLSAVGAFLVNFSFARFADDQSMMMFALSAGVAQALSQPDVVVTISFWVLASPAPLFILWDRKRQYLFDVPVFSPIALEPLFDEARRFLAPLLPGQRVLVAYEDPQRAYPRIFGAHRVGKELMQYMASVARVHLFPDWWMVFELNYVGAPQYWGTELPQVLENMTRWDATHVVITTPPGAQVGTEWTSAGFQPLTSFSWVAVARSFPEDQLFSSEPGDWWLLERRTS